MNWDEKEILLRLEASKVAQERSRFAFFASLIIALSILAINWNGYVSIYRNFAIQQFNKNHPSIRATELRAESQSRGNNAPLDEKAFQNNGTNYLQERLMTEWVNSRFITVSLLGFKVGVGDTPEIGGLAVFIASVWFFLVSRRENYTIATLLKDGWNSGDEKIRWLIYHGINSYTVFTNSYRFDNPIRSLSQKDLDNLDGQKIPDLLAKKVNVARGAKHLAVTTLYYLPVIALAFALIMDVLTSTGKWMSPFRLLDDPMLMPFDIEIIYWIASLVMLIVNIALISVIFEFARSTENILVEYRKMLLCQTDRASHVSPIIIQPRT